MEAEETARDEVPAEKKTEEELRPTKPGKKRLSVVLSILVSFLVGMPLFCSFSLRRKKLNVYIYNHIGSILKAKGFF